MFLTEPARKPGIFFFCQGGIPLGKGFLCTSVGDGSACSFALLQPLHGAVGKKPHRFCYTFDVLKFNFPGAQGGVIAGEQASLGHAHVFPGVVGYAKSNIEWKADVGTLA